MGLRSVFEGPTATFVDVVHLDLSSNRIASIKIAAFSSWTRNLRYLNLSHNDLGAIPIAEFPTHGNLLTLDLSFNKIRRVHPQAFGPTFPDACNPTVDFRMAGNPCSCSLVRGAPQARQCNTVECDCFEGGDNTVPCGETLDTTVPINETVRASQVCDGVPDCSNCWDEARYGCTHTGVWQGGGG
jgi:hypothetical protein